MSHSPTPKIVNWYCKKWEMPASFCCLWLCEVRFDKFDHLVLKVLICLTWAEASVLLRKSCKHDGDLKECNTGNSTQHRRDRRAALIRAWPNKIMPRSRLQPRRSCIRAWKLTARESHKKRRGNYCRNEITTTDLFIDRHKNAVKTSRNASHLVVASKW